MRAGVTNDVDVSVFEYDVQRMYNARDKAQDGEGNVDQQINTTTFLGQHTQWRQDDGQDDLANVATGERHFRLIKRLEDLEK